MPTHKATPQPLHFTTDFLSLHCMQSCLPSFLALGSGNVEQEAKRKKIFEENKINVKYVWNGDILKYTDAKRFNEKEKKEYNE